MKSWKSTDHLLKLLYWHFVIFPLPNDYSPCTSSNIKYSNVRKGQIMTTILLICYRRKIICLSLFLFVFSVLPMHWLMGIPEMSCFFIISEIKVPLWRTSNKRKRKINYSTVSFSSRLLLLLFLNPCFRY